MDLPPVQFQDVSTLLESSEVRPRLPWMRFGMSAFVAMVLMSWFVGRGSPEMRSVITVFSSLGMLGLVMAMSVLSFLAVRAQREEHARVEGIEELIQLRRWPDAAMMVQAILSQPARSPVARVQALVYLSMVLARYHRFTEAVVVYDYLLNEIPLDDAAIQAVKLGRGMVILREDHLFDADRAIADLRRGDRAGENAGLALLEIYRDVKTGHPAEAIETFEKRVGQIRGQLGHRVADAWALAARAYDLLGRRDQAQTAYENATILSPLAELQRKYPEIAALAEKYQPSPSPREVA